MLFFQPAAPGLGIKAGNQDCSEGLGFILKSSSPVGLIRQTKLRREPEKGASECEAPQPQGDISPSGKKHPWGGSGGSALPGGPHLNARGCKHSVGTFSRCPSLVGEGHVLVAARAGPGAVRPPPPRAWDSSEGSSRGPPAWHRCPQHLPGTGPGCSGAGGPAHPHRPGPPGRAGCSPRCDVTKLPDDVPGGCHGNRVMSQRSDSPRGGRNGTARPNFPAEPPALPGMPRFPFPRPEGRAATPPPAPAAAPLPPGPAVPR